MFVNFSSLLSPRPAPVLFFFNFFYVKAAFFFYVYFTRFHLVEPNFFFGFFFCLSLEGSRVIYSLYTGIFVCCYLVECLVGESYG
ncbi:hypothetical protein GGS21DRAFT_524100 [Xylaria nigripes]|nr:hypothetical protein GGS21DRAFT_524100 [Xylaria nigripes]